jgi:hypothetical protein
MDDIPGRKLVSSGDGRFSRPASADLIAFLLQLFCTGSGKNSAADSTAHLKCSVRRIDYGIHMHFCDIIPNQFQRHIGFPLTHHSISHYNRNY